MDLLMRGLLVLGVLGVFLGVVLGMGAKQVKPAYSQNTMIVGLVMIGLWFLIRTVQGFTQKDPMEEIRKRREEAEAAKRAESAAGEKSEDAES